MRREVKLGISKWLKDRATQGYEKRDMECYEIKYNKRA